MNLNPSEATAVRNVLDNHNLNFRKHGGQIVYFGSMIEYFTNFEMFLESVGNEMDFGSSFIIKNYHIFGDSILVFI